MTHLLPAYRLTIFNNDGSVLTPATGAPHSDEFKVATQQNISGFQPYMNSPRGSKGKFNPVSKRLEIGSIGVTLGDQILGTDRLQRWISAFPGDDSGKVKLLGLKAAIEESIDGGVTWTVFYVGRIKRFELEGRLRWNLTIKEENRLQRDIELFRTEPSASLLDHSAGGYANRLQVAPYGPSDGYGPIGIRPKIKGRWRDAKTARNRAIEILLGQSPNDLSGMVWVSKPLLDKVPEFNTTNAWKKESEGRVGPIVRVTDGSTTGRFYLTYLEVYFNTQLVLAGSPDIIRSLLLEPIDPSQFEYQPLSAFSHGDDIDLQIFLDEEPTQNLPLLIDDVHPGQLWKDALLGKFSSLDPSDGSALFSGSVELDVGQFDSLIANERLQTARYIITKPEEMGKWVEKNILQTYNLGYRLEPTGSAGRFFSKVVPFSLALPTSSAGIPTITTDDLVAGAPISWKPGEPFLQFTLTYYQDRFTSPATLLLEKREEDTNFREGAENTTLVTTSPVQNITFLADNIFSSKNRPFEIDAQGLRYFTFESFPINIAEYRRWIVIKNLAFNLRDQAVDRWGRGPASAPIETHRTSATNDCKIGDWRILDIDFLPGPGTHQRGEARLMQCVARNDNGPTIQFEFLDSGLTIELDEPTVGTFAQIVGTRTISGTVAVPSASIVEGGFAATNTSTSSRPDETSSVWLNTFRDSFEGAGPVTNSVVLGEVPANARIWPRFRRKTLVTADFEIPSDYAFPPAPGYIDTVALNQPTSLIMTNITGESATAQWTNTEATASLRVRLKPASSASFQKVASLRPGTTQTTIYGLSEAASENPYELGVSYVDGVSVSAETTVAFTAAGQLPTAPVPIGIRILYQTGDPTQIDPLY